MFKIIKDNVTVDFESKYASYKTEDGQILEVDLHLGEYSHDGEKYFTLDWIEPIENSYDIENQDELIEALYEYLIAKYPVV